MAMNNRSSITRNFHKALNLGLKNTFGKIPSSTELANQFNLRAYGTKTISRETARKWKNGLAMPEPSNLQVLIEWLNLSSEYIFSQSKNTNHQLKINSASKPKNFNELHRISISSQKNDIEKLAQAAIDHVTPRTAVLDETGKIILANDAWKQHAIQSISLDQTKIGNEANSLDAYHNASGMEMEYATKMVAGIKSVMRGQESEYRLKYPCHTPVHEQWYMVRVTTYSKDGYKLTVVIHEDISKNRFLES